MKLGILKTGAPPAPLEAQFGGYPDMFQRLLGEDAYDYAVFDVAAGQTPASPETCDAYLVTGSSAGVYDAEPWIGDLIGFLQAAKGRAEALDIAHCRTLFTQVRTIPAIAGLSAQHHEPL